METQYVLGERLAVKFSAFTYHQKQRHWASGKFVVNFWGSVWTFVSEKGGRKRQWEGPEEERNTERVQMDAVVGHYQPRGSRKAFFSPSGLCEAWAHSSIEIQYWSLPTQTMMALNRLAFTVVCFLHQGASITQLGQRRQKALFFTPARVQSPLGFYSVALH